MTNYYHAIEVWLQYFRECRSKKKGICYAILPILKLLPNLAGTVLVVV